MKTVSVSFQSLENKCAAMEENIGPRAKAKKYFIDIFFLGETIVIISFLDNVIIGQNHVRSQSPKQDYDYVKSNIGNMR